jgi:hypothetical protein
VCERVGDGKVEKKEKEEEKEKEVGEGGRKGSDQREGKKKKRRVEEKEKGTEKRGERTCFLSPPLPKLPSSFCNSLTYFPNTLSLLLELD